MRKRLFIQWIAVTIGLCGIPLAAAALSGTDTDGDHIPDAWEQANGLDPSNPADADLDPDGDRLSNRDEFYAGTAPFVANPGGSLTDRQALRLFQGKAFLYFWEQSRPYYYFTADNADYNNPANYSSNFNSIATTGFALMSYVVADANGWVDRASAYERIRALLSRAVALQSPTYDVLSGQGYPQGNRRGYLYHFVDDYGFKSGPGVEISTVDHAFLVVGALTAGEYYKGTEVEQLARQLYLNTDWNWMYNTNALPHLWQSWREPTPCQAFQTPYDGGCVFDEWNRYSELLVLMFLAMGHPDPAKAIPSSAWGNSLTHNSDLMFPFEWAHLTPGSAPQNFSFVPNVPNTLNRPGFQNSATELHFLFAGSLHNHQYSHLFADFRARPDGLGTNYFNNSIAATLANRQYCIRLNQTAYGGDPSSPDPYLRQPYETYGPNTWGLMAGLASDGYKTLQPITIPTEDFSPAHLAINNDSGTVVLSAPLGSVPFTPRQVADALKDLVARFQSRLPGFDALIGRYGFRNAYNLGRTATGQLGHFPSQIIGLDLGPAVGSAENFFSGLPWKFAMRNDFLRQGMQVAGFNTGNVEPFILNFDSAPPIPHEDPNGGGQDPNSFGGYSGAWGTGSIQYISIGDPFPSQPYGPQEWAQRIAVSDNGSGAFITLNRHSVSQWDRVSFWIRRTTAQAVFLVGLKDVATDAFGAPLQQTEVKVPIAAYHPAGEITTTWTEVRIPLRVFADGGVRLTQLDNLSFTGAGPAGTIEVDDIAFLGDEFAPAAPQGLVGSANGTSATLAWTPNNEPDVVGYRVYRRLAGTGSFSSLTTTLVTGPAFTDTTVSPTAAYEYRVTAVDNAQPQNESAPSATVTVVVSAAPVVITTPAVGAVVNRAQPVPFAGAARAAAGDTVAGLSVTALNHATKPPTPVYNQTLSVPVGQQTVSWNFTLPPPNSFTPQGIIQVKVSATSTLTGQPIGSASVAIINNGTVLACYVLSVAYGDPVAWQIQTLNTLRLAFAARHPAWHAAYLRWYDRVGPRIAQRLQEQPVLRALVRAVFTPAARIARWWLSSKHAPSSPGTFRPGTSSLK